MDEIHLCGLEWVEYLNVDNEGNYPGGKWKIEDCDSQQHSNVGQNYGCNAASQRVELKDQHTQSKYEKCWDVGARNTLIQ